jgi:hypothetical protein
MRRLLVSLVGLTSPLVRSYAVTPSLQRLPHIRGGSRHTTSTAIAVDIEQLIVERTESVRAPPLDTRTYRHVTLARRAAWVRCSCTTRKPIAPPQPSRFYGGSSSARGPRGPTSVAVPCCRPSAPRRAAARCQQAGAAHARVMGIRAASHEGFDRIVLEFEGNTVPGYRLAPLSPPLTNCTSGAPVTVEGGGALQIQLAGTSGHDDAGASTTPLELRPALPSVREIERTCDFEGVVAFAVGVATPTPFRAFPLAAPARLVVDVKR